MIKKAITKNASLLSFGAIAFVLLFYFGFLVFEPQTSGAVSTSTSVGVYQQVTEELSLTCDSEATGTPAINGMTGGTASTTFACTAVTNNVGGYNMKLAKTGKLCHTVNGCGTDTQFDDYPGTTSNPIDFDWQNAGNGEEYWGFSVASSSNPASVTQRFRDDGSKCNEGTNVTDGKCWVRIPTDPTKETVVNRGSATTPSGERTEFRLQFQAGPNNTLVSGTYHTTLTVTIATN